MSFKWASLVAFFVQNSILIVGLRACAIYTNINHDDHINSAVVVVTEVVKLVLSLIVCFLFDAGGDAFVLKDIIFKGFVDEGADVLKLLLPAILYCIQNNLQYVIESAPVFLVAYQMKIITTALFYSAILKRRLSLKEWSCVVMLAIGVSSVESSQHDILEHHVSNIGGYLSVVVACLTSGFAGVYFEKIAKSSKSSIWVLNIQMSLLSCFMSVFVCLIQNPEQLIQFGFWRGFNEFVWLIVVMQAVTGLVVALVVNYADNICKSFAASASIVLSTTFDAFFFQDATINETYLAGALSVALSCFAFVVISEGKTGTSNVSHTGSHNIHNPQQNNYNGALTFKTPEI